MKKLGIAIGIVAIVTVSGILVAQPDKPGGQQTGSQQPANQQVLAASSKQLGDGTKIYDVRTTEEFAVSHVQDATLLPLADIQSGKLPDVPKDTPIAVYCRSGNRSNQATQLLRDAGYTSVTDMGGLNNLANFGLKAE